MKNLYIIICAVLVLINSLIGLIFTHYQTFNWIIANAIIIINAILLISLANAKIVDGFKISLTFILPILGLLSFLISIRLNSNIENNILLAGILIIFSFQILLLIAAKHIKTKL
jgi:hypothetical protein